MGTVISAVHHKGVVTDSVNYSNERNQFGRPIAKYGAIKHKLALMAIKCYAVESQWENNSGSIFIMSNNTMIFLCWIGG